MNQIIETASVSRVKEMALAMVNDFQDGSDLVMAALLANLETRIPAAEFISFCEEIEAAT